MSLTEPLLDDSAEDAEVGRVLDAHLAALEAGQPSDLDRLIASNPAIARRLRACLAVMGQLNGLAGAGTPRLRPTAVDVNPGVLGPFGDYELVGEIARGGMGVVYEARQRSLDRTVALKMILAGRFSSAAEVQRFQAEARAVALLDHPRIVPVYEVGEHEGHHYFTMKRIEGASLAEHLDRYAAGPRAAARLLADVARAVHHAHQRGVLHRDLKPSNILLDTEGQPHVVDFGLAKRLGDDQGLTTTGAVLGTPGYLAPEQAVGQKGAVTTLTDVYGLGAILYALLAGRPPYEGASLGEVLQRIREQSPEPPGRLRGGVDRDLETICLKCLQRDPDQRYASAEALAADLDRYLRGEPILARPLSPFRRLWLWCRRRERIREAGTFAIGLGVTLFTWCAGGFLMVWAGSIQPKRTDRFLIYLACCMFGVYLPLIGLGWKTLQDRLWAIWGAIGLALFGCGYMIAKVSGLIYVDSGGVLDARDATMAVGGDALIIVIALLLLLSQVLALIAHHSNKR